MVTSHASIESRLTAMDSRLAAMDSRLTAMDGRHHEVITRLGRIEGHLGLSAWVGSTLDIVGIDLDSQHGLFWEAARATGISAGRLKLDLLPDVGDLLRGSSFEMPLGSMGWPNGSMGCPSRMAGVEALVIIPGQRFSAVTPA